MGSTAESSGTTATNKTRSLATGCARTLMMPVTAVLFSAHTSAANVSTRTAALGCTGGRGLASSPRLPPPLEGL